MNEIGLTFWWFTIIALVIGTVLTLCVVTKESKEITPDDKHNATRATLFLLLGILLALVIIVFLMTDMVKGMKDIM